MSSSRALVYYWYPAMVSFLNDILKAFLLSIITLGHPECGPKWFNYSWKLLSSRSTRLQKPIFSILYLQDLFFFYKRSCENVSADEYYVLSSCIVSFLSDLYLWSSVSCLRTNDAQFTKWVYKSFGSKEEYFPIKAIVKDVELPIDPQLTLHETQLYRINTFFSFLGERSFNISNKLETICLGMPLLSMC